MLASGDDYLANPGMGKRYGEVDDDLDVVIGEQAVDRHCFNAIVPRLRGRHVGVEVGKRFDGDKVRARSTLQIGIADIATTDDADRRFVHGCPHRLMLVR